MHSDSKLHDVLVCPQCRARLWWCGATSLDCRSCGRSFPVQNEVSDFGEGRLFDVFAGEESLSVDQRRGLEGEAEGAEYRIREYFLPLMRAHFGALEDRRVLDCGCGNGISVDVLNEDGVDAWGVDLSALRRWQWRERAFRGKLAVADALRLPFPDAYFDVILSSGLLEHLGVTETRNSTYAVVPNADRDAVRSAFISELARVLKPAGIIWLDFPNGACPIDFWHTDRIGVPRWHPRDEGFLPTVPELENYVAPATSLEVTVLSSHGRLRFEQVSRRWYGRVLRGPVRFWLFLLRVWPISHLLRSGLNPYVVVELRRATRGRSYPAVSS